MSLLSFLSELKQILLCYLKKLAASLTLDIGEDRILLETRSNVYRLDIYLPFLLLQEDCTAQFNRRTKVTVYGSQLPSLIVIFCIDVLIFPIILISVQYVQFQNWNYNISLSHQNT